MSETPETNAPAPVADATENADLGEGGKKALQAERDARKQAELTVKDLQAKIDAAAAEKLTDIEKAQQAQQAAETAAAEARVEALRYRLAAKHGISDEDASLFLTASTEEAMQAQAERLAARTAQDQSPRNPKPDPTQGGFGKPSPGTTGEQFASFIESKL